MVSLQSSTPVIYPDSDGKPMADNTKQFRWIVVIQQNLDWLFAKDANVFVAGDLLWYPIEGNNKICTAPDTLVVFGRPKGDRGSYKQWEEANIPPQVVFEILSPSNTRTEMEKKLLFYDRHGVEEYYVYDPDRVELEGWQRREGYLDIIDPMQDWISPRLNIRFDLSQEELQLYHANGAKFLTYTEIAQQAQQAQQEAQQAQQEAQQAQQEAQQAQHRATQAEAALDEERRRAQALAERLRAAGIDPDSI
ncbi:MAG: Uma2 family endonuclease [Oculatellaceae cyanobacterium bins.114]|nr:Uma2 family endonuclease [Oculatellaceae cyanobacterium bins.114]